MYSDISRGSQNWSADKTRWIDTFATQMGATQRHEERTERAMEQLDLNKYSARHIPVEHIIVGVLSLYIDEEITSFDNRALERDGVRALIEDLECSISEYESIRSLLRTEDGDILF
jgi:hypothetical protein